MTAREAIAYHEAGHVVAAWDLGVRIKHATVIPDAEDLGHVMHHDPLRGIRLDFDQSARARMRAEQMIIVCLAGPIAHRRHSPRSWRHHMGHGDHTRAVDLSSRFTSSEQETEAHLKWLTLRARALLDAHWPRVEAVAAALVERGKLEAAEIERILVRAG